MLSTRISEEGMDVWSRNTRKVSNSPSIEREKKRVNNGQNKREVTNDSTREWELLFDLLCHYFSNKEGRNVKLIKQKREFETIKMKTCFGFQNIIVLLST